MADQEVLVALLRDKKDYALLKGEGWYRIPIEHTPKRWPPDIIGFYQPKAFGADAFRIRHYGKVLKIDQVERRSLFPNEFESSKSKRMYHQIHIERLEQLPRPIPTRLTRPIVFIPTVWTKFIQAEELNDLFDESPLEDILWEELKQRKIMAERQWPVFLKDLNYILDFAFFCNRGKLDVETDGDTYHIGKEQGARDNKRNNDIEALGWHVMRFNSFQIREQSIKYCLQKIQVSITNLGGLIDDGLVPRKFIEGKSISGQQLSLFDEKETYTTDSESDFLD